MFKQIQKKTAINLVVGSLGAGKTTLIKQLLAKKPHSENWAILVNEFGAIGIDGAILENQDTAGNNSYKIKQIPGGCICCTALTGFQDAIKEVMQEYQPERIFIEPTGIGEPETMVDLLNNHYFKTHFDIQTIFAVLDSKITKVPQFKQLTIMQNLVDVADVIVLNKIDTADSENLKSLNDFAQQLYPPKAAIVKTENAHIDIALISKVTQTKTPFTLSMMNDKHPPLANTSKHEKLTKTHQSTTQNSLSFDSEPFLIKGLIQRKTQQQLGTLSIGWVFENNICFDWKILLTLFQNLANAKFSAEKPLRAKGVFKVGEPSMLFQWVNEQEISREFIAYKRDSRLEILLNENNPFNLVYFEKALAKCLKKP